VLEWAAVLGLALAAAIASPAQGEQPLPDVVKFKTLVKFDGPTVATPSAVWYKAFTGTCTARRHGPGANGGGELVDSAASNHFANRRVVFRYAFRTWSLLICTVKNSSTRLAAF